jgi:hypothetical protein
VLRQKHPSALKRIRAFCKECAPDFDPKTCDGKILNTEESRRYGNCSVWPFKNGRNPHLKGKGNVDNLIPFKKSCEKSPIESLRINESDINKGSVRKDK